MNGDRRRATVPGSSVDDEHAEWGADDHEPEPEERQDDAPVGFRSIREDGAGRMPIAGGPICHVPSLAIVGQPSSTEKDGGPNPQDCEQGNDAQPDPPVSARGGVIGGEVEKEGRATGSSTRQHLQSVALYLRVSTEEQDLAGQERELREESGRRGWAVVAVFAEKVSGTGKVERVEYDRLLAEAATAERPWTHSLVWSLDRFSRAETFTKATQAVLDLETLGVRFHSLKEPQLDTPEDGVPTIGRDVLLALLPVVAGFESKRRSERVRVAMREIKEGRRPTRSGRPPGRPRRVTPELAARVRELRARGLPWKTVAQHVGLPSGTCRKVGPLDGS